MIEITLAKDLSILKLYLDQYIPTIFFPYRQTGGLFKSLPKMQVL